jgi:uncharacterized protein (TIGR03067 family)
MRTFLACTAVLLVAVGVRAGVKPAAPAPKPSEAPKIDGSYTVNYTSVVSVGGFVGPGGPGGGRIMNNQIALRSSSATISKNQIMIGNWYANADDGSLPPRLRLQLAGAPQAMTYVIDPTTTPMSIDVTMVDLRNKKTKSLGIIDVADDRITIAVGKPGADRPKTLDENEEVTVFYFKKAPPPARDEYRIVAMTVGKEADAEKELNRLAAEGFQVVNTTNPSAADSKSSVTTVHFLLTRTAKHP